jgi:hypothetical protein
MIECRGSKCLSLVSEPKSSQTRTILNEAKYLLKNYLFPNRTHYQIHTVHNVPHPEMFIEAWTTIVNVCYVIVFMKGMGK